MIVKPQKDKFHWRRWKIRFNQVQPLLLLTFTDNIYDHATQQER